MANLPDDILGLIVSNYEFKMPSKTVVSQSRYYADPWMNWQSGPMSELRTLSNLCLVSQTFRRLSQPLMYRSFRRNQTAKDEETQTRLFLRTLLERPDLADMVHELSLESWATQHDEDRGDKYAYIPTAPPSKLAAMYHTDKLPVLANESVQSELLVDLQAGRQDAEICILVACCRNVKSLSFICGFGMSEGKGSYLYRILEDQWDSKSNIAPKDRILAKLEHLSFCHWDTEYAVSITEITPLLHLPCLTSLRGDQVNASRGFSPGEAPCGLTSVSLYDSVWDNEGLASLLQVCPTLESLSIAAGGVCVGDIEHNFMELGQILRRNAKQLKRLSIDPRDPGGDYTEFLDDELTLLGSLQALTCLEYLMMPLTQLLDFEDDDQGTTLEHIDHIYERLRHDILPSSVTEVVILDYYANDNASDAGQNKCVSYNGTNGDQKLKLRICSRSSWSDSVCEIVEQWPLFD